MPAVYVGIIEIILEWHPLLISTPSEAPTNVRRWKRPQALYQVYGASLMALFDPSTAGLLQRSTLLLLGI